MLRTITSSVRSISSHPVVSRITASEFRLRRERLEQTIRNALPSSSQDAVILLKGAVRSYIAPDVPHAFRQCSHFRYMTGVATVSGCSYLIYVPAKGSPHRVLFMDHRSEYDQLWEGPLTSDSELELTAGFDEILPIGKIEQVLNKMSSSSTVLYLEYDQWSMNSMNKIRSSYSSTRGINTYIDGLRVIKSMDELESMRDTCRIGGQMMSSTIAKSKEYVSENAIVGLLEYEARRRGASMLAYPPVVAAGNRANTIHYLDANKSIQAGESVLVDAGCDVNGYVSDITRCWPISGEWSSTHEELYEALREVHEQLLQFAHEMGQVRLSSLFRRMIELLAAYMLEIGLIPKGTDNKRMLQMAEELCPHHVSHYLGMDVHDCVSVSRDIDLPPGVVFTIEPGVYVPHSDSSPFPKRFHGIGFRIEDDIVTTTQGIEVLTDHVPRAARDISYIMNSE